ncbi:MAG: type II secretion system secretin GspD [Burkholderiales bacterium]
MPPFKPTKARRTAQFHLAAVSLAVCLLYGPLGGTLQAQVAVGTGNASVRAGEMVTLNFSNADIEAVARTMATITGRNVIVDPRVKGTLTLVTDKPVSTSAAFNQFLAAMRLQGFTVVESAGLYKVVPEAEAKLQSNTVLSTPAGGSAPAASGGQIVTQIFRLTHENATNLVPILRPLISPNNTINVNPGNNSLVITDYADNLQRIGRIIAATDVANATEVEIIPLRNAIATDLAPLVLRLADGANASGAPVAGQPDSARTSLIAEPRSNALILRAPNPARASLVRSLVARLDQAPQTSPNGNAGNIYVVYLKNADATKIAVTLRAAMAASAGAGGGSGGLTSVSSPGTSAAALGAAIGGAISASAQSAATTSSLGGASSSQPSTGGQIQADPATNSLIITAPEPQYRQLRAVIDKLDSRRAQVFVETLIAEINADKAAEFGIQLQGLIGRAGNAVIGAAGTNFGSAGANIFSLASQAAATGAITPTSGLNIGIARDVNGTYVLSALARFMETNGTGNILSTPNLLTLDNEEARIVIGQNVPFITGSFTNTGGGNNGSVNPFQTVERRDVGLTVRVKPQISENGTVKMQVFLESSSVQANSINSPTGLITNKRSIESNVLVEDGAIVVLGGLLQDQFSDTLEKVPVLGDVPYLGNLFKTENRSRSKTNLMVFLRPVVIRDALASDALASDRYEQIRGEQRSNQPTHSDVLPINAAPVLPPQVPLPARAPAPPTPLITPAGPQ